MKTVTGEVTSIHEKDFHGTMLYSFKLDEKPSFWRCGRDKPDVTVKDYIRFNAKLQNVIVPSIEQAQRPEEKLTLNTEIPEREPEQEEPVTRVTQEVNVNDRIRYQAARRDATNLVVAALHTDALPWTAAQQKNKSKKLDLLTGYIEQVTETLLNQENHNA
jgi:hypothetical protein